VLLAEVDMTRLLVYSIHLFTIHWTRTDEKVLSD